MAESLPWFPLLVDDVLTSTACIAMNNLEFGCYMRLLIYQWRDGSISSDLRELAALLHMADDDFLKAWQRVRKKFEPLGEDGKRFVNLKLEEVRTEQRAKNDAATEQRREAGRRSADSRRERSLNGRLTAAELPFDGRETGRRQISDTRYGPPSSSHDDDSGPNLRERVRAERAPKRPEGMASRWPSVDDVPALRALATEFVLEYANCKDPKKQKPQVDHYANVLSSMRGRGVTVVDAWYAFHRLRRSLDAPVFGARAKEALTHLPSRRTTA